MNNPSPFPPSKAQLNRERREREAKEIVDGYPRGARVTRVRESRVPRFGSAEWCETQGDNLGESPDH